VIIEQKKIAAMKALQSVIIHGRIMAYEKADYNRIADLLDRAEYLAGMFYENRDMTVTFRENLVEIAELHNCGIALTQFDTNC
jgi:hypothetical protein